MKELLAKILSAVSVTMDEIIIMETFPEGDYTIGKMICFGSAPDTSDRQHFEVSKIFGGEILLAPSLIDVSKSRDEKMKLWNALKNWFSIK